MVGNKTSLIRVLLNGILKKCPNCSKGKIFSGYLNINKYCSHCNEHLSIYRTDDFGPWLSIVLAGHIVVPLVLSAEQTFAPTFMASGYYMDTFFIVCCFISASYIKKYMPCNYVAIKNEESRNR